MGYNGPDRRGQQRRMTEEEHPNYFEQMILQHLSQQMPAQPISRDITETTMSLKSLGPLILVAVSGFGFLVGGWINLNGTIDKNKNDAITQISELRHAYEMNKVQMEKVALDAEKTVTKLETKLDVIDRRISELDSSVSQMYQRVTTPKGK